MREIENNNEIFIKDIYGSAFLFASGMRLLRLVRQDNFYWFVFEGRGKCEKLLESYWRGEGVVVPRLYADACKTLKDRLFAQR